MEDREEKNIPLGASSSPTEATASSPASYPRHVKLPFNLRDPNVKFEGPVLTALGAIFPKTTNIVISINRSYIHFSVEELPQTPLPLTVGGLPITIGESHGSKGKGPLFPRSTPGNMSVRICQDLDARAKSISVASSCREFIDTVTRSFFAQAPNIPVVEIIFDIEMNFHIVLRDDVDIQSVYHQLPGRIARCWTMYLHEKDMGKPKRVQVHPAVLPNPTQGIVDSTPYETLRPGVVISSPISANSPQALTTTSGVMVKNSAGDCFMTATSHGIGDCQKLFQTLPLGGPKEIGEAVLDITCTDVSLVRLSNGIGFTNAPFNQDGESVPRLTRLYGEATDDQINTHLEVSLYSPFTGTMAGVIVAMSWKMEATPPIHPTEAKHEYNVYHWTWVGQDVTAATQRIPDSACGSAIWDDDGRVIGFFHHYIESGPWAGFYAFLSADEVVRAGYRLA